MPRLRWILALAVFALAHFAHADSFQVTQVTVFFGCPGCTNPFTTGVNVVISMTGPGTNIQAIGGFECDDQWCETSQFGLAPGTSLLPQMNGTALFLSEVDTAVVGGTEFESIPGGFVFDGLTVNTLGGPFVLPPGSRDNETFTACLPANVSGPVTAEGIVLSSGVTIQNINLLLPTTTGTFCTTWIFQGGWFLSQGKFSVSSTPEPGTIILTGSGLVALIGALRRKRNSRP